MAQDKRKPPQQSVRHKPYAFGVEGLGMLSLAFLFDMVNVILGILDFVAIGIVLGPLWNFVASWTVGIWLAYQTVQDFKWQQLKAGAKRRRKGRRILVKISKRVLVPFLGNSTPIAKFFPFWLWRVWGALEKNPVSNPEEVREDQQPAPGGSAAPARGVA